MNEFDAYTGGVEVGGLRSMLEIKILVCYILDRVNEKMSREQLSDSLREIELVNFFALNEAIDELLKQQMLEETETNDGKKLLNVTTSGKTHAQELEKRILGGVRNRAVNSALKTLAKAKAEKETDVKIEKTDSGFNLTFKIKDEKANTDLVKLSLFAPDILQAEQLRDKFLENPAKIYSGIIDLLTN